MCEEKSNKNFNASFTYVLCQKQMSTSLNLKLSEFWVHVNLRLYSVDGEYVWLIRNQMIIK